MPTAAHPRPSHVGWLGATAFASLLNLCCSAAAPAQPVGDDFATRVLAEANRYRQGHNLSVLQPAPALAALAAEHSAHMAQLGRLSHAGFQERFRRARRTTCVENLAAGFVDARPLVAAWRVSPSHHENLLDERVQDVGVASVAGHVTWLACSAEAAPGR